MRVLSAIVQFHRHPGRRSYLGIFGMALIWLPYKIARAFVDWADDL